MVPIVDGTSHNMVKRSDDPLPLEEVVMQLSANLQQLQTQVSVLQTKLGNLLFVCAWLLVYFVTCQSHSLI